MPPAGDTRDNATMHLLSCGVFGYLTSVGRKCQRDRFRMTQLAARMCSDTWHLPLRGISLAKETQRETKGRPGTSLRVLGNAGVICGQLVLAVRPARDHESRS